MVCEKKASEPISDISLALKGFKNDAFFFVNNSEDTRSALSRHRLPLIDVSIAGHRFQYVFFPVYCTRGSPSKSEMCCLLMTFRPHCTSQLAREDTLQKPGRDRWGYKEVCVVVNRLRSLTVRTTHVPPFAWARLSCVLARFALFFIRCQP